MQLLQGDSAAVVLNLILKFSQKSIKSFDTNLHTLLLTLKTGVRNILMQCFEKKIIIFDCLLLITTLLLNRENSSMKCKYQRLSPS